MDHDNADAVRQAQQRIEEHVTECSIVTVWCSAMQERVTDHVDSIAIGKRIAKAMIEAGKYAV